MNYSVSPSPSVASSSSITIAPHPVNALLPTVTPVLKMGLSRLSPYDDYQVEFSPVLGGSWSNLAAPFVPTSTTNTQFINVPGMGGFFRAKHLP